MLWAMVGLAVGLSIGFALPWKIPLFYARYLSVALLAAMDSALGGLRAGFEGKFDNIVFISGFSSNSILAAILTYMGDRLGVELYYAGSFAFGYRIFLNLGATRRLMIKNWLETKKKQKVSP